MKSIDSFVRGSSLGSTGAWFACLSTCFGIALGLLHETDALAETPRVYPDAESVEPLPIGVEIPSAEVRTIDGESVDLAQRLGDRGALLVFYRGGW